MHASRGDRRGPPAEAAGLPSIPPEHLLRALLLQVLYTVRSERLLMAHLDYNLLFRWFVGLAMDDPIWDATVFTKNRERLLRGNIARAFFARVRSQAEQRGLLSDEHFTVDASGAQVGECPNEGLWAKRRARAGGRRAAKEVACRKQGVTAAVV